MQYADALASLYALQGRGARLGLQRVKRALELRGHPERGVPFIHVAGTNGKGSVARMLEAILRRAGYRTGLFTSPHLHRFTERVRIAGREIGPGEVVRRWQQLQPFLQTPGAPELTFFEVTTLMALESFRYHECDVVILEVGLGGRLDSTNAVPSELAVITRIARDHVHILGDSIAGIAKEKAGILHRGAAAVIGVGQEEARRAIRARASRLKVRAWWMPQDFGWEDGSRATRFDVVVQGRRLRDLQLRLQGRYQRHNAACAVAAALRLQQDGWHVEEQAIRAGLKATRWPGRLERLRRHPEIWLDAAHNQDGSEALAVHLQARRATRRPIVVVFGTMSDKDSAGMLAALAKAADRFVFTRPPMPRATPPSELRRLQKGAMARNVAHALARATRIAGPDGVVAVAGSIYLVAEARAQLLGIRADPPIRM